MVSIKQLQANRLNAQKSTGPKTPKGKAKSAQNAVSHGLTASRPILSIEDKDEFDCFANDILVWLDPQNPIETLLARRIAILSWRFQRAAVYETLVLDNLLQNQPELKEHDNESKTGTGTFCRQAGCTCPPFADAADADDNLGSILTADFQNQQTLTKVQNYETRLERSMLRCLNTLRRIRDSQLLTYSRIQDYLYGAEDMPKPYFKDEQNEPKFPQHLQNRMSGQPFIPSTAENPCHSDSTGSNPNSSGVSEAKPGEKTPSNIPQPQMGLKPIPQNEPISDGVIPAQAGIQSSPKNSEFESVQSAESVVSPIPASEQTDDEPLNFYPRWDSVVLDLVGYPAAKRRKMTKEEREEAADQVLLNLKDPKQFLLDYNLISIKPKNEPNPEQKRGLVCSGDSKVVPVPAFGG